ncbi:sugar phosphate isomerase/epimerase [Rhodobacteraceae bacterium CCMM004]|nr:sugar phosphate isomerase/epimerase [Rhodobacteraceae bacterium CCMM004]
MTALAVSTVLFDGYDFDVALSELAGAGVTRVEPAFIRGYVDFDESDFSETAAARLGQKAAAHGLGIASVSAHLDLGAPGAEDMLRRRIAFAAGLGARHLLTNTADRADEDRFLRVMEQIAPSCEAAGVVLALENPGHGTDSLIGNLADGNALMQRIGGAWVGLNYDIGNVHTYSQGQCDPRKDLDNDLRHIVHVHAKDIDEPGGNWVFTPIGQGVLDYAAILRRLAQREDLPIALEIPLRLERPARADPRRRASPPPLDEIRAALAASLAFCRAHGIG